MKKIALCLMILTSPCYADFYRGQFQLADPQFHALSMRELNDGMWLVGAQKDAWALYKWHQDNTKQEIFHVSFFWATRLEGQETAYGPALGFPVGTAVQSVAAMIAAASKLVPSVGDLTDEKNSWSVPQWVKTIDSFTSIDVYGGYRPVIAYDSHHYIYGIGGKINIPVGDIYKWAFGK